MPANNAIGVDWLEVRDLVEQGISDREISRRLAEQDIKLSHVAIGKRRNKEGWGSTDIESAVTKWKPDVTDLECVKNPTPRGKRSGRLAKNIIKQIAEKGISPSNAAARCNLSAGGLSMWRKEDPAFNDMIDQAQRTFLATREENVNQAGDRGDLRANLAVLERHPLAAEQWAMKGAMGQGGPAINVTINIPDPKPIEPPTITIEPSND